MTELSLKEMTVGGFRGFGNDASLELAMPNGSVGSGLTILVGPNNAGKSSVLEALKLCGSRQLSEFGRSVRNVPYGDRVCIRYTMSDGSEAELNSLVAGSYAAGWSPTNVAPMNNQIYTVPARRGLQSTFNRGVSTRQDYNTATSQLHSDRNQSPEITGRLMKIVEDRELKASFDDDVGRLLGEHLPWELDRLETGQYVFTIKGSTGSHTSDGLGFGILSVFYIVAGFFDAQDNTVVCIDEPELSMHPQIQRRAADYLAEQSARVQVVVSTHSPYFVDPTWFAAGAELARCYIRDGSTRISHLSQETKRTLQGLVADLNNPHVLGLDAREVFFAEEGVLVVEGQEDVILLRRIAAQLGAALPHSFFGWGAGGADKVRLILAILKDLGFEWVSSLLDGDRSETSEDLKKQFPHYSHFVLPADDVRDKPAHSRSAKAGVCTDSGQLKDEFIQSMKDLLDAIAGSGTKKAEP